MRSSADIPALHLKDIAFAYPGGKPVLDELNFRYFLGSRIGLLGANGSGKTTLFHIIMGLIKPDAGEIELFGKTVAKEKDFIEVRRKIGMLFQNSDDQLFSPTVLEDVAFGPLNLGKTPTEATEIAKNTLSQLGLSGFEDRITHKLSGGEKRLISLATVLSMKPDILLLDEPTTGLDNQTKSRLIDVLSQIDISFILISHEIDFLMDTTEAIYVMENGKIDADHSVHVHQHVHAHKLGAHPHDHQ